MITNDGIKIVGTARAINRPRIFIHIYILMKTITRGWWLRHKKFSSTAAQSNVFRLFESYKIGEMTCSLRILKKYNRNISRKDRVDRGETRLATEERFLG